MSVVYTCVACCYDFDSTYYLAQEITKNINVFHGSGAVNRSRLCVGLVFSSLSS